MSEPFVGEIRIFAGNYLPDDWAFCEGQSISIADYTELYTIIGTRYYYGNDRSRTEFVLPDLRGTAPMHPGKAPGLSMYSPGQRVGESEVTLTVDDMGTHNHRVHGVEVLPNSSSAEGSYIARAVDRNDNLYQDSTANLVPFEELGEVGTGNAHHNMQPYQALRFIIALKGVYPPQG